MSPRKKHGDENVETEAGVEEETGETSAADWMSAEEEAVIETPEETAEASTTEEEPVAETEVVAETPEEAAEVSVTAEEKEGVETSAIAGKVNLKTLASGLYQMGLDLGLAPDEAALLTSETKLPAFIGEEGVEEFKQGLVEAYQEMLDERLHSLKQKLGVG